MRYTANGTCSATDGYASEVNGAPMRACRIARCGSDPVRSRREAEDRGVRVWYRGLRRQINAFDPDALKASVPEADALARSLLMA